MPQLQTAPAANRPAIGKLASFAVLVSFIVAAPIAVFGQSPPPGMTIGSKQVVVNVDGSQPGFQNGSFNTTEADESITTTLPGALFFEARISSNDSAIMVPAIVIEINKTGSADGSQFVRNITGVSAYSSPDDEPIVYLNHIDLEWSSSDNQSRSLVNTEPFPVNIPPGGILGITLGASGLSDGDQVKVTFVYLTNSASAVTTNAVPVADVRLASLDVVSISTVQADNASFAIDNAFINPEIHCELCTRVEYKPVTLQAEAAYVAQEMHIKGAKSLEFWARGQEGGETLTFKAAGKQGQNGTIVYANSTQLTLGTDWKRYEIDLPNQITNLSSVTHLFAFETSANSTQTFYLKGIAYR